MKKALNLKALSAGIFLFSITLFPVTALAKDGIDTESSSNVNVETRIGNSDEGNISVESDDNLNSQGENENDNEDEMGIEVDHDSAVNATSTIDRPERVTNRGELRSFLNHVTKEDERIADVSVSSTTIETSYALPAKFLWSIPTDLTANISVKNDGTVTITYPWYAFLFAKKGDDLAAQLTGSATSTIGTNASTTLSASAQAHLLNLLFSVLKNSAER